MAVSAVMTLALMLALSEAQLGSDTPPSEMTWQQMKSPKLYNNQKWCNLPENTEPRSGSEQYDFICDPHRILSKKHITSINWVLRDAAKNGTSCPCSNYYCENPKPSHTMTGYHIGVALVNKMKVENNINTEQPISLEDQATEFAYKLATDNWKFGRCDETIIVLYSKEDQMIAVRAAKTAGRKLTREAVNLIIRKNNQFFQQQRVAEGLHELLHDMKILLNCNANTLADCEVHLRTSGSEVVTLSLTLVTVCVATLLSLWQ